MNIIYLVVNITSPYLVFKYTLNTLKASSVSKRLLMSIESIMARQDRKIKQCDRG